MNNCIGGKVVSTKLFSVKNDRISIVWSLYWISTRTFEQLWRRKEKESLGLTVSTIRERVKKNSRKYCGDYWEVSANRCPTSNLVDKVSIWGLIWWDMIYLWLREATRGNRRYLIGGNLGTGDQMFPLQRFVKKS